jgi:hypothetical protein
MNAPVSGNDGCCVANREAAEGIAVSASLSATLENMRMRRRRAMHDAAALNACFARKHFPNTAVADIS